MLSVESLQHVLALGAIIIPVVVGLTEALKQSGIPSRYAPLSSIVVGMVLSVLTFGLSTLSAVAGIIYGLSASGLYSGTKAVTTKPADVPTPTETLPSTDTTTDTPPPTA